ncbi:WhiB family transcriptional regulator [Streptomyces sp. NPDC015346]|uniref:WhiB family transcriptional regulator n=1 Tax=Streptomyces sp. NPDC015346 TaxID=3364954 RepID=UPI0036F52A87
MSRWLAAELIGLLSPRDLTGPAGRPLAPDPEYTLLPPDSPAWQTVAACAGLPPAVVFSRRAKQAAPALRACTNCPVRRECEEAVAPAESFFDGVCAGRLWRNGRPVPASRTGVGTASRTTTLPAPATDSATDSAAPSSAAAAAAAAGSVRV